MEEDTNLQLKENEEHFLVLLKRCLTFVPTQVEICGSFALNIFQRLHKTKLKYECKEWDYGDVDIFITGGTFGNKKQRVNYREIVDEFEKRLEKYGYKVSKREVKRFTEEVTNARWADKLLRAKPREIGAGVDEDVPLGHDCDIRLINFWIEGIPFDISIVNSQDQMRIVDVIKSFDISCCSVACTLLKELDEKDFNFEFTFAHWSASDFRKIVSAGFLGAAGIDSYVDIVEGYAHSMSASFSKRRILKYMTRGFTIRKYNSLDLFTSEEFDGNLDGKIAFLESPEEKVGGIAAQKNDADNEVADGVNEEEANTNAIGDEERDDDDEDEGGVDVGVGVGPSIINPLPPNPPAQIRKKFVNSYIDPSNSRYAKKVCIPTEIEHRNMKPCNDNVDLASILKNVPKSGIKVMTLNMDMRLNGANVALLIETIRNDDPTCVCLQEVTLNCFQYICDSTELKRLGYSLYSNMAETYVRASQYNLERRVHGICLLSKLKLVDFWSIPFKASNDRNETEMERRFDIAIYDEFLLVNCHAESPVRARGDNDAIRCTQFERIRSEITLAMSKYQLYCCVISGDLNCRDGSESDKVLKKYFIDTNKSGPVSTLVIHGDKCTNKYEFYYDRILQNYPGFLVPSGWSCDKSKQGFSDHGIVSVNLTIDKTSIARLKSELDEDTGTQQLQIEMGKLPRKNIQYEAPLDTSRCFKIVLTGGSRGGKSSIISLLKSRLEKKGFDVIVCSETARELLQTVGGYKAENEICLGLLEVIIKAQLHKEDMLVDLAKIRLSNRCIMICDRGACDGFASLPDPAQWMALLRKFHMTNESLVSRYDAVIHMQSSACYDNGKLYQLESTLSSDPSKFQAVERAVEDDLKLETAYRSSKCYFKAMCGETFEHKENQVLQFLDRRLDIALGYCRPRRRVKVTGVRIPSTSSSSSSSCCPVAIPTPDPEVEIFETFITKVFNSAYQQGKSPRLDYQIRQHRKVSSRALQSSEKEKIIIGASDEPFCCEIREFLDSDEARDRRAISTMKDCQELFASLEREQAKVEVYRKITYVFWEKGFFYKLLYYKRLGESAQYLFNEDIQKGQGLDLTTLLHIVAEPTTSFSSPTSSTPSTPSSSSSSSSPPSRSHASLELALGSGVLLLEYEAIPTGPSPFPAWLAPSYSSSSSYASSPSILSEDQASLLLLAQSESLNIDEQFIDEQREISDPVSHETDSPIPSLDDRSSSSNSSSGKEGESNPNDMANRVSGTCIISDEGSESSSGGGASRNDVRPCKIKVSSYFDKTVTVDDVLQEFKSNEGILVLDYKFSLSQYNNLKKVTVLLKTHEMAALLVLKYDRFLFRGGCRLFVSVGIDDEGFSSRPKLGLGLELGLGLGSYARRRRGMMGLILPDSIFYHLHAHVDEETGRAKLGAIDYTEAFNRKLLLSSTPSGAGLDMDHLKKAVWSADFTNSDDTDPLPNISVNASVNFTEGAKWFPVASVSDMEQVLSTCKVSDRVAYEVIPDGVKCKPYLDVDMYVPNDNEHSLKECATQTSELIEPMREEVKRVFLAHFGIELELTNIHIDIKPPRVKKAKPDKVAISLHITVNQPGVYFNSVSDQRKFWWSLCDLDSDGQVVWKLNKLGNSTGKPMVKLNGFEIDSSVYTQLRSWCLLYCGKVEGDLRKVFHPPGSDPAVFIGSEWRKRLICHGDELKQTSLLVIPPNLVLLFKEKFDKE